MLWIWGDTMKYFIIALLLCGCSPKETHQNPTLPQTAGRGCIQPSTFMALPAYGMSMGEVVGILGQEYVIADSNQFNGVEFKTLQWKDCGNAFSVTFKNGNINSKFMIGGAH